MGQVKCSFMLPSGFLNDLTCQSFGVSLFTVFTIYYDATDGTSILCSNIWGISFLKKIHGKLYTRNSWQFKRNWGSYAGTKRYLCPTK